MTAFGEHSHLSIEKLTRTVVVDGPLALRRCRLEAARAGRTGLHILTLPQLAARLAGGFTRPTTSADLELAVQGALAAGQFAEMGSLAALPGVMRAVLFTLDRLWKAGLEVRDHARDHPRLADLSLIEDRIRGSLRGGALIVPDLLAAAMARRDLFGRLAGRIAFDHVHHPAPVWRPLVEALAETSTIDWTGCAPPTGWAVPKATNVPAATPAISAARPVEVLSCAHPQAEVTEALRWARALIASGQALPAEVAIAATAPERWDDMFLGLAVGANLPIHFSHGLPILASYDGQACAALADLLQEGLSFSRFDRMLRHGVQRSPLLENLPSQPLAGLAPGAALATPAQWRRALARAGEARTDGFDIAAALDPVLTLVAQGVASAAEAGAQLLPRKAAMLWRTALRRAPAAALTFTLAGMRIPDERDPGANVVWGPAAHLAASPRAHVRLIGMTARLWPRPRRDDPLLPDHIFQLDPALAGTRTEQDRWRFTEIANSARAGLLLSFPRRTPLGGAQTPSPLLPRDAAWQPLARLRVPAHAYSESDRLQARPKDGTEQGRLVRPMAFARDRRRPEVTASDGRVRANHPAITGALARVQSAASLRYLLRDPQAFVWRYALGWHETLKEPQPLALDDRAFGDLVHRLLQHTVARLERDRGLAAAAQHEIEDAMSASRARIAVDWPTERPTPPPMLWRHTLDRAERLALAALRLDTFKAGTRSWTEVSFGDAASGQRIPWEGEATVKVPGTAFSIRGWIDRVEVAAGERAVRITDYKTGAVPSRPAELVLGGGGELQRVLYSVVAHQHLPEAALHADLVFLGDAAPVRYPLRDIAAATEKVGRMLNGMAAVLVRGDSLPGRGSTERWNPYRLARAAAGEPTNKAKTAAAAIALQDIEWVWREP